MNPEATPYELFDQYLDGDMDAAGKAAFEERLQTDAAFGEQFHVYKNLQADYTLMERNRQQEAAVTTTLHGLNREYFAAPAAKKGRVVSMKSRWYMVAAAASIIAAFFVLKPMLFTSGDANLFNKYYREEELGTARGIADSAALSATLFNGKEYAKALAVLEPYTTAHPDATDLLMARGASYLQTGDYAKANAVFTPIAAGQTVYAQRAQWMLAMVQLKQDKKAATKQLLAAITTESAYYSQAQELLTKL